MKPRLNDVAMQRLADAPTASKGILERAYRGKASPRGAIKAFCLQCVGYLRKDVTGCTAVACPLFAYRPYQSGSREETEDGPADGRSES